MAMEMVMLIVMVMVLVMVPNTLSQVGRLYYCQYQHYFFLFTENLLLNNDSTGETTAAQV